MKQYTPQEFSTKLIDRSSFVIMRNTMPPRDPDEDEDEDVDKRRGRHRRRTVVCGRLNRLVLKRGHKPPTAKPKIMPVSKRRPALLAACAHPEARKMSRKTVGRQPKKFSKRELYAMLADAVRNTG